MATLLPAKTTTVVKIVKPAAKDMKQGTALAFALKLDPINSTT